MSFTFIWYRLLAKLKEKRKILSYKKKFFYCDIRVFFQYTQLSNWYCFNLIYWSNLFWSSHQKPKLVDVKSFKEPKYYQYSIINQILVNKRCFYLVRFWSFDCRFFWVKTIKIKIDFSKISFMTHFTVFIKFRFFFLRIGNTFEDKEISDI